MCPGAFDFNFQLCFLWNGACQLFFILTNLKTDKCVGDNKERQPRQFTRLGMLIINEQTEPRQVEVSNAREILNRKISNAEDVSCSWQSLNF